MSRKVTAQCEIRSELILKDTLTQMGLKFSSSSKDQVSIDRKYNHLTINYKTGNISFDSDDKKIVDNIKQEYMVNFCKDRAIREGNKLNVVRKADGTVHISVL